ncbi:MAG: hypothetical protein H7312_18080, partial [Tardiphaga sp.]|nr:hypothetical protein [Tardiphaga sp.]
MPRKLPKYVQAFLDTHNHPRFYFRKKGAPRVTLPGLPWSEGFMRAHAAALIGGKPDSPPDDLVAARQPAQMIIPKSMAALIRDFKRSRFPELGAVTQANYTRLLAKLELVAGHLPVAGIKPEDIQR